MQSSVYHTTSKKIYYFGGYYNDVNAIGTANLTFREAIVFNTATATWEKQAFTGGVIPTVRRYHTMTLCKKLLYINSWLIYSINFCINW